MNKEELFSKKVVCPGCGGPSLYASSNPFRPFCSERCKKTDLGAWADESFRLPADSAADGGFDEDSKRQ